MKKTIAALCPVILVALCLIWPSGAAARPVFSGASDTTLHGLALATPASGDDGKFIYYDHATTSYLYGTPAGGGDMTEAVWDGDSNGCIDMDAGGLNVSLSDPGADRLLFWDESSGVSGAYAFLTVGTGLAISTTTIAVDTELQALAGLTSAANKLPYFTGSGTADVTDLSAVGRDIIDSGTTEAARATLGVAIGTNVQAYDAELAALAGLTSAANKLPYFTGSGTADVTDLSAVGRDIIDSGTTEAARATLGVAISTDVQAYNSSLAAIAGGTWTGANSITTLGTIATGVWSGTAIVKEKIAADLTTANLAAALTFADGDLVDLSGVTMSASADEGLTLPVWANVTPGTGTKRFITWDESGGVLKIYTGSGWTTINPSAGAPTDVAYLVIGSGSGSLSAERVITEGLAIDFADGGANSTYTIAFDPTELTGDRTWAAGGAASVAWTWDLSGTDTTLTMGSDLFTFSNSVTVATGKNITLGTTQWNSADEIDGTKIKDADYGDISVSAAGAWTIDNGVVAAADLANADFGVFTVAAGVASLDADTVNATHIDWGTGVNQIDIDDIPDSANYQKIAAADVDANSHVNRWYVAGGAGYATIAGPTGAVALTVDDAAQTLAARNRDNTFTENNTFGNADTDTLTVRSLIQGGNSRAVWIASSAPSPTYATGVTDFYVAGNVEVGGIAYAAGGFVSTGAGDSYVSLANNAAYNPSSGYQIYFEGGVLKQYAGTEYDILTTASAPTLTGATWSFASVTNFVLPHGNSATADASGEIAFDDDDDRIVFQIASTQRYFDFSGDGSGKILKSDGSGHFTLEDDATGGSPTFNSVGDPTGDTTITMDAGEEVNFLYTGNYTTGSQFLIQQLTGNPSGGTLFEVRAADGDTGLAKFGDGTNAILISPAGAMTLAGTASITAGGIVLGDASPDANGEIGYASNAFNWYANSEDMVWTAGSNTWTYSSNTGANLVLGNPSATNINVTSGVTVGSVLWPDANAGAALGTASVSWSDLFLASGAVINFNNGDVTVTHSANTLAFAGGTSYTYDAAVTVTGAMLPGAANTHALGSATAEWSDLYLGDGAVVYFQNDQSVYVTASASTLTLTGAWVTTGAITPSVANGAALGSATNEWADLYLHDGAVIYGQADQSATLTSSASLWTANNLSVTTQFKLPSSNADPTATAGYFRHDSTVANFDGGALKYHSGTSEFQVVAMVSATAGGCTDDQVVAYDADLDVFYCKADADSAGTPAAITVAAGGDADSFVAIFEAASGDLGPKTDTGLTWNSTTDSLTIAGDLVVTGRASGGAKTYSVASGVTNATQLSDVDGVSTMAAAEVNGTLINIDASGVTRFTLPTPASGYNCLFTVGVSGVTVQVESGTTMYVNGTATATGGVGAQIVSVTPGEYISCWTVNMPGVMAGGGGEIEWMCRKTED